MSYLYGTDEVVRRDQGATSRPQRPRGLSVIIVRD